MLSAPEGGGFAAPLRPGSERTSSAAHGSRAVERAARRATTASRSGHRAEFETYYHRACPRLIALQHALLGDRDRAAASAREAFVRAWLSWKAIRSMPDRDAWLRRAAREARETRGHLTWFAGRSPRTSPGPRLSASNLELLRALGQLPGVQRRAVVLRHMAGLTDEQIAAEESASVEVIDARLAHGQLSLARWSCGASTDLVGAAPGWSAERIDDWAAREFSYLAYGLAPTGDLPPVRAVIQLAAQRRRTTVGVAAAVLVVGGVGAAVGHTMSNGTFDGFLESAEGARPRPVTGPVWHGPTPGLGGTGTQPGGTAPVPDESAPRPGGAVPRGWPVPGVLPDPGAGRPATLLSALADPGPPTTWADEDADDAADRPGGGHDREDGSDHPGRRDGPDGHEGKDGSGGGGRCERPWWTSWSADDCHRFELPRAHPAPRPPAPTAAGASPVPRAPAAPAPGAGTRSFDGRSADGSRPRPADDRTRQDRSTQGRTGPAGHRYSARSSAGAEAEHSSGGGADGFSGRRSRGQPGGGDSGGSHSGGSHSGGDSGGSHSGARHSGGGGHSGGGRGAGSGN